ncbi:hypothetical protein RQP46_000091 [Phenoliferia psychrophenolica]
MMEPTTSPPTLIPIVFDIIGTCFSFDASINALQKTLGEEMRLAGSLSVSGAYRPFLELLKANLSRVLVAARVHPLYLPPHTPWDPFSLAPVLATLEWMYPRDSLLPASCLLLGTGKFQLLAATSGDHLAAQKAGFKTAWISSGDAAPAEEIWGAPDLIAKDLEAAAREIMRREADCAPTLSRVDE